MVGTKPGESMGSRAAFVLTVIFAGSLLSGCGGGDGGVLHSGGSLVLVDEDHSGDATVGVGYGGVVAMAGDCVGIDGATVVWPHGTTIVSGNPLTIKVPGLGRVTLGDQVSGGGGDYGVHVPKGIDAIPTGCPTERVVAFYPGQ